jgi:hypothetical protein
MRSQADRTLALAAFNAWLDPTNFAANGGQRRSLSAMTAALVASSGIPARILAARRGKILSPCSPAGRGGRT